MEDKQKYVCPFCGAEYATPVEQAKCVLACDEKRKQEMERVKKIKLNEEKAARKNAVVEKYNDFIGAWNQYITDYADRSPIEIMGRGKSLLDVLTDGLWM